LGRRVDWWKVSSRESREIVPFWHISNSAGLWTFSVQEEARVRVALTIVSNALFAFDLREERAIRELVAPFASEERQNAPFASEGRQNERIASKERQNAPFVSEERQNTPIVREERQNTPFASEERQNAPMRAMG